MLLNILRSVSLECYFSEGKCIKSLLIDAKQIFKNQHRMSVSFGLNLFYYISHEKGLGRAKMLCHSPLRHGYRCIEIIIYSHNTFTHTHVHYHQRDTMLLQIINMF